LKTLLIATRVLAFLILLFVPAIAVLLLVAFAIGQTLWFTFIGLLALFVNAVIVFAKPQRDRVWRRISAIART
jgi:ABC-type nickel/cobalt efflux system permease component RcnA